MGVGMITYHLLLILNLRVRVSIDILFHCNKNHIQSAFSQFINSNEMFVT
jgi:hypothetical protein